VARRHARAFQRFVKLTKITGVSPDRSQVDASEFGSAQPAGETTVLQANQRQSDFAAIPIGPPFSRTKPDPRRETVPNADDQ